MSDYKDIIDALDILIEYPDLMEYIKTFNSPDGFMYTTETDIKRKECANRLDELLNTDGKHTGSSWGTMLRGVQSVLNGVKSREYMIYKNNEEQNIHYVHQEFMYQLKQEKVQKEQAKQEQAQKEQAKQEQAHQEQAEQEQAQQEQAKQEQAQEQHWQEQVEAQVQSQKDFEEQWQEQVEQWQVEQLEFKKRQAEQWQAQEEQKQVKQEQARQEQAQRQAEQKDFEEQHAKILADFELRVEKANKERAILYEAEYKLHINANC